MFSKFLKVMKKIVYRILKMDMIKVNAEVTMYFLMGKITDNIKDYKF